MRLTYCNPLQKHIVVGGRAEGRAHFFVTIKGVSNPREGSVILIFHFRPRLVCSSLLHCRSSWKGSSGKFVDDSVMEI